MPGNRAARFWSTACASASGWSKWVQSLRDALGRRLAQSNPRPRRFNEAPIHESGKWRALGGESQDRVLASMRPRFMNRGSLPEKSGEVARRFGFNEAPIHESGKFAPI